MGRNNNSAEGLSAFLVVAISPALIVLMVGSMVFYLMLVTYDGAFAGRLTVSCGLFICAAVLVARISIDEGREYAGFFALPLSVVTLLSIMKYTDAGLLFMLPLVAFIWWSTDKLTWDCTVVDHQKDASGQGLIETVGLKSDDEQANIDREATTDSAASDVKSLFQRWIERRRRHHTPGVWVVYFGLAAIPLFGLGQAFLPEYASGEGFFLLCVYVASALSLLMTTSFLQLRRYLNQRNLALPDSTASTWLVTGTLLIVALMFVCLLLPRPNTGYSWIDTFSKTSSRDDLTASRWGIGKEGVSDDQQGTGNSSEEEPESNAERGQESRTAKNSNRPGENAGSANSEKTQSDDNQGESKGQGGESKPQEQNGSKQKPDDERRGPGGSESQSGRQQQASAKNNEGSKQSTPNNRSPETAAPPPPPTNPLQNLSLGSLAKWIYYGLIAILVGYVLIRYWREITTAIAAFLRELAEFWRRLFGRKKKQRPAIETVAAVPTKPARPFASFQDPFADGLAARLSPQQLVSYTFEAMQAWAAERDCGRAPDQTPMEFAGQLGHTTIGTLARNLAILYNQAAYAPGTLSGEAAEHVRRVWMAMRG